MKRRKINSLPSYCPLLYKHAVLELNYDLSTFPDYDCAIFIFHIHSIYSINLSIKSYQLITVVLSIFKTSLKCHFLLKSFLIGIQSPFIWSSKVFSAFSIPSNLSSSLFSLIFLMCKWDNIFTSLQRWFLDKPDNIEDHILNKIIHLSRSSLMPHSYYFLLYWVLGVYLCINSNFCPQASCSLVKSTEKKTWLVCIVIKVVLKVVFWQQHLSLVTSYPGVLCQSKVVIRTRKMSFFAQQLNSSLNFQTKELCGGSELWLAPNE